MVSVLKSFVTFGQKLAAASLLGASLSSPATADLIDFDSLPVGAKIDSIQEVTFSSNIGLDLLVSSGFSTTSGTNYLGVDDGGFEVFLPGDVIDLGFSQPVRSLSVNFISTPSTPSAAFGIETLSGTVLSSAPPSFILPDGGEVFFLSIDALTAFSSAKLTSVDNGLFSFNIDDIVFSVPEPATIALMGLGLAGLGYRRYKAA